MGLFPPTLIRFHYSVIVGRLRTLDLSGGKARANKKKYFKTSIISKYPYSGCKRYVREGDACLLMVHRLGGSE